MRQVHSFGLPPKAHNFLEQYAMKLDYCVHCSHHSGYESDAVYACGMFGGYTLKNYRLYNHEFAEEFIQHRAWYSTPVMWLGLHTPSGDIVWSNEEISDELND